MWKLMDTFFPNENYGYVSLCLGLMTCNLTVYNIWNFVDRKIIVAGRKCVT